MDASNTTEPNLEAQSDKAPGRTTIIFLVVTAFLNTMGAGMLSPVLPFIVRQYVSSENTLAITVGWFVAVYALCQFIAAPGLGALSDRFGRRPIRYSSSEEWQWPGSGSGAPEFRASRAH